MTLLERLTRATGPDRQLDREIEETLTGVLRHSDHRMVADGYVISGDFHPRYSPGQAYLPARYTKSVDAAMTLLPEADGFQLNQNSLADYIAPGKSFAFVGRGGYVDGANPAIALTIAALKARGIE